ncbi:MAG: enoyl-CoA hydratase/isomerase family protein [Rhizobiales bacterium]|nr:enoyl-CoA hydratase/isomerase family protein [Hyphomicrobiales bacterium]
MSNEADVSVKVEGAIAVVTIERPEVRNALRHATLQGLRDAITKIGADASIKAGIVTGAGGLAFSAGADLKALHQANPDRIAAEGFMRVGQATCAAIWGSSKPIVAAIEGYALGGGFEVALSCHQRIATPESLFGLPEIKLRHLPAWGGVSRLVALTRARTLFLMALSGELINARQGYEDGFVDELSEPGELLGKAKSLATRLSVGEPEIMARGLEILRHSLDVEKPAVLAMERWAAGIDFDTDEHREQINKFALKHSISKS